MTDGSGQWFSERPGSRTPGGRDVLVEQTGVCASNNRGPGGRLDPLPPGLQPRSSLAGAVMLRGTGPTSGSQQFPSPALFQLFLPPPAPSPIRWPSGGGDTPPPQPTQLQGWAQEKDQTPGRGYAGWLPLFAAARALLGCNEAPLEGTGVFPCPCLQARSRPGSSCTCGAGSLPTAGRPRPHG